jgi:hypothetical protein
MAGQWSWQAWEAFPSTVKTGKPAMDMVFGMPAFDWLAQHPDEAKRFSETMVAVHGAEPPAVAAAYDFSSCGLIVDVGGASGHLLAHVLAKHPRPKGVLFDLPQAMTDAPMRLQALGVADRVTFRGQRFQVYAARPMHIFSHVIRLERGQVPHYPSQLSRRDDPDQPIAHHRAGATRGQCSWLWQLGHGDDGVDRRCGADPQRVCVVARTSRTDDDACASDNH